MNKEEFKKRFKYNMKLNNKKIEFHQPVELQYLDLVIFQLVNIYTTMQGKNQYKNKNQELIQIHNA